MVQINQAWELLRDPVRRAAVDRATSPQPRTSARVVAADGMGTAAARREVDTSRTTRRGGVRARRVAVPGNAGPQRPDHSASGRSNARHRASRPSRPRGPPPGGHVHQPAGRGRRAGPPPGNPSGSIINFGRYEGWTLGEIARTDLEYLEWLDRMPIGRTYQTEIDAILRRHGRRTASSDAGDERGGAFRRR